MKVGDKVKLITGEPFGIVGIIKRTWYTTKPVTIRKHELIKVEYIEYFECETEDGTIFSGTKEDLEIIK